MKRIIVYVGKSVRGLGIVSYLLGGLATLGWYIAWLDDHFLWRLVANILGFFTSPFVPIAIVIEWVWHGWPHEVTSYFKLMALGAILNIIGSILKIIEIPE